MEHLLFSFDLLGGQSTHGQDDSSARSLLNHGVPKRHKVLGWDAQAGNRGFIAFRVKLESLVRCLSLALEREKPCDVSQVKLETL